MLSRVAVVLSLLCALVTAATADDHSLHITGTVVGGWTDNLFSTPDEPVVGVPNPPPLKEADVYAQFRPGLLGTWARGRAILQATYELEANLYADHDEANSLQHILGVGGFFLTSPRTELSTGLRMQTGTLNSFTTRSLAANGEFTVLPSGASDYTSAEVNELLAFTATRDLRLSQNFRFLHFSAFDPNLASNPQRNVSSGQTVFLEGIADRSFRYSAVALRANAVLTSTGGHNDERDFDTNRQLTAAIAGGWRRDFGPRWTTALDAGVTAVVPLQEVNTSFQPTFGAQVGYFPEWGSAGVAVRRAIAPNLFVGQNTITDSASIFGWLPLPWFTEDIREPTLAIGGSVGINRTQLLDIDTGDDVGTYDVIGGDVALAYNVREGVVVSARYQYLNQDIVDAGLGTANIWGYTRNSVMITVGGRFPYRLAADLPERETLRVDRRNVDPVGEEIDANRAPGANPGGGGGGGR